ncbi:MAG: hypothetical protein KGI37_07725 [Alphaproteobacteria bacterium]|nr:hypothetical protein [Alphaproteobacteria bacterium]
MAKEKENETETVVKIVSVTVAPRKSVLDHTGHHKAASIIEVDEAEAQRLVKKGFVTMGEQKPVAASEGPTVTTAGGASVQVV